MCLLQLRAQTSYMYPTAAGAWRLRGPDEALLVAAASQPLSMQHVNCEGGGSYIQASSYGCGHITLLPHTAGAN